MSIKCLLKFVFLIILVASPALADDNICAESVRAMVDVPDGYVTFTIADGKGALVVNLTAKQYIGRGYYSVATTQFKLKPSTKVTATDRGVELANGDTRSFVLYSALNGLETLVPHIDLSTVLKLVEKDGDVGFTVDIKWDFKMEQIKPVTNGVTSVEVGSESLNGYSRKQSVKTTSTRSGYQWYLSPLLRAQIDATATLKAVHSCVTEFAISRSVNPPLKTEPRAFYK